MQNALSNVNGFGDAFDGLAGLDAQPDIAAATTEANGASNDNTAAVEEAPPVMVTFMADPEVYMKRSNLHALGSLVSLARQRNMQSSLRLTSFPPGALITADISGKAH